MPKETVMGFQQIPFILFGLLGLPPSGKIGSASKIENHGLASKLAHHFKTTSGSLKKCLLNENEDSKITMHKVKEMHYDGLFESQLPTAEVRVVDL